MVDASPDHLSFDAAGLSGDDAFARYRELYAGGADAERLGDTVGIKVEAWRLDRMVLYDRRLDNIGHRRDAGRVHSTGFSHFTVTLLLDGRFECDTDGAPPVVLQAGEMVLLDTRRGGSNRMYGAHLATLSIARERLAAIAEDTGFLHGFVIGADNARLYREFVESLLRNLPSMPASAATASGGVLCALLSMALDRTAADRRIENDARDVERLSRFKRLIDQRLGDPAFDVDDAVREAKLSRSAIYRLVASEGGLATLIRNRRLEALRVRLGDPAEARSFARLAEVVGLASTSHASRAFAERFGLTPSEYRRIATAGSGSDAFLKMRLWQAEVL